MGAYICVPLVGKHRLIGNKLRFSICYISNKYENIWWGINQDTMKNTQWKTVISLDYFHMSKVPVFWVVGLALPFPTMSFLCLLEKLLASILWIMCYREQHLIWARETEKRREEKSQVKPLVINTHLIIQVIHLKHNFCHLFPTGLMHIRVKTHVNFLSCYFT